VCRIKRRLQLATEIADSNPTTKQYRLAAVLFKGGVLLKAGQNTEKAAYTTGYTLHAERAVFRDETLKETAGLLYVSRVRSRGDVSVSRPCEECLGFLVEETKVIRVYFTINSEHHGSINLRALRRSK
jgi:cytidine deaminase